MRSRRRDRRRRERDGQAHGVPGTSAITTLKQVDESFVDSAPRRHVFDAVVRAPIRLVWNTISGDAATWKEWFPGVGAGGQDGEPKLGVYRWVTVQGTRYDETVIVWEPPNRWAFRVDKTSLPMAKALVEQWTMEPIGDDATQVRWTFAMEPGLFFKLSGPIAPRVMRALFKRAMRNLERRLS